MGMLPTGVASVIRARSEARKKAADEAKARGEEPPKDDRPAQRFSMQPRIVYEDDMIVQRKGWFVPKADLPVKEPTDSEWDYFYKLNSWRLSNGIPEEVFVFINPNRWQQVQDPEKTRRLTRDDYKPQYNKLYACATGYSF